MQFFSLNSTTALEALRQNSFQQTQIIFKHSTRCSISKMVFNRFSNVTNFANGKYHLLLVIEDRALSNTIADDFNIKHESPQILVIKNGICIYNESHTAINMEDIIAIA
ncbi:MAG TPA: bacillithiol system redox-active protein YtxJ [Chitinophagaceae bacterium]|nr:bacillithiol system redox-active protein YtxJ [Chitinophagaceae bacterium]HNE93718.1 bacillithiol system redox-active protein YtxJ [Chitinophagaceae bacterium]HNJ58470.1 bacillithiol system redox-active protein YtxJ [Chitinophagaceae bacterium]HNM34963.1 bacillithiol system redox-active protein YtxJ [Chitinophagaceae bacterium]